MFTLDGGHGGSWERHVTALAMATTRAPRILGGGSERNDGVRLIRSGAKLLAVGHVTGVLSSNGGELRFRFASSGMLGAWSPADEEGAEEFDTAECVALSAVAGHFDRLDRPLLVTTGGRSGLLPFIRYRCMEKAIPFPSLHVSLDGRLTYLHRDVNNWHLDLSDALSSYGANFPLNADDLFALGRNSQSPAPQRRRRTLETEALQILGLFIRFLAVTGKLAPNDLWRGAADLEDALRAASSARVATCPEVSG